MPDINLDMLIEASSPGGPSCLTSITELAPAGGWHVSVAPAKFAPPESGKTGGVYAWERRYVDDGLAHTVLIDSKQSQLNRIEAALELAIADGHPVLSRIPRVVVTYDRPAGPITYSDLTLPHRAFDGHIRAGSVDGTPTTDVAAYRAARDASSANARALLELSPATLVFGGWDSMRKSSQGRWRSALVGEIIGVVASATDGDRTPSKALRGGARVDPVGMSIQVTGPVLGELADGQRKEMSPRTFDKIKKDASSKPTELRSAAALGLGGVPPTLSSLAGVACRRIIRSHVLSFATLRQMRFGAGPEGDAACRALLAALALNGLARADAELYLRANCDLVEDGPTDVVIDRRAGVKEKLEPLSIAAADSLLAAALDRAEKAAGIQWSGVVLQVTGNPAVVAGAVDTEDTGR